MNLEDLEKKYPKISEKGWVDLHFKRGSKEINDKEFKNELLKFGIESSDADSYIEIIDDLSDEIKDFLKMQKLWK